MKTEPEIKTIYHKGTHTSMEVSMTACRQYETETRAIRRRRQEENNCYCPRTQWGRCDGMCQDCAYYMAQEASLEQERKNDAGDTYHLLDIIPSELPSIENTVTNQDLLRLIYKRLSEMDDEADRIFSLWESHPEGISDREMARILHRPQRTFARMMKRLRDEFRHLYKLQ